ncbi:hypothetical protein M6B38_286880 [Iris pallida]|uniref:Uncharacterized protein n=1 Tax=Iris pallida TaxID=29817 RepID=A0AAX6HYY0_IRIPA|nr:hypothetical protein M6B38_286880 [Iris pallida]
MFNENTMFHLADRVMRQFGLKQMIPLDPLPSSISKANIEDRTAHFLVGWYSRFSTHGVEHMSEIMTSIVDMAGNEDFVRWYGRPLMQNRRYQFEEPRFEARAIDDRSLCEHRGRVELAVDVCMTQMSQVSGADPTGMFGDTLEYLRQSLEPDFVPLDVPTDHPIGIVRQRHAHPRTTKSHARSADDAEGPSHPYASTSDPYTGPSHPYAGTSDPYAGPSYPYAGISDPYAGPSRPHADTSDSYEGASQSYHGASQSYEGTPHGTSHAFDWNYYKETTRYSLFGPSHLDPSSQFYSTPSVLPSQVEEPPEVTEERRRRLGLRQVDRRDYRRDDRGG